MGIENQTIVLRDTKEPTFDSESKKNYRKQKKAVSITLIDTITNRLSVADCVRVDMDHFQSHRQAYLER